ncbi:MAG: hypothetical protein AB4063_04575 [Crocosphaera sp.]
MNNFEPSGTKVHIIAKISKEWPFDMIPCSKPYTDWDEANRELEQRYEDAGRPKGFPYSLISRYL